MITVKCCQACARFFALVPGVGFSILLTGVGWSFFRGKRIPATRSLCASSQFAGEFDVHVQLSFLLSARASCEKRILASRLCASSQLARAHRDCVAGSSALGVSALGSTISSKQSVSVLSNPDVACRPMQTGGLALALKF